MRSRVAEAILLTALVAGWRGLFLGEKPSSIVDCAIRMSQGWAVAHHFYPRITNSYVLLRKMTTRMSTALQDGLGWVKSPEIPSLSNGVNAVSPPLVVVGVKKSSIGGKQYLDYL